MNTDFKMTAPAPTSSFPQKEKNPNIQLQPMGTHPAILYSIVNVGTQHETFEGKEKLVNKIKFTFEFPLNKQLFYKDDVEPRPNVLTMEMTYSVSKNKKTAKKSNLLLLIEGLYGPIPEAQYLTFDISSMLGQKVFASVTHYQKRDGTIGAKINGVSPFNPAMIDPNTINRTNELTIYGTQMGFENEYFAKLYYFDRELIKNSIEGKEHASKGGRFAKFDESKNLVFDDATSNGSSVAAPAPILGKLVMTNPAITYEQMKQAGWTDDNLVAYGHAHREVVAVQAPVAPTPVAPIPQPIPAIPQIPVAVQPTVIKELVINNGTPLSTWTTAGWTEEMIVAQGHGHYKEVIVAPTPVAPVPVPSVPQLPVVPVQEAPAIPMAPPASPTDMFAQAPIAPVQQIAGPIPTAPQPTAFEQASTPGAFSEEEHDDLPF